MAEVGVETAQFVFPVYCCTSRQNQIQMSDYVIKVQ